LQKGTNLKVVPNRRDKYNECVLRSTCRNARSRTGPLPISNGVIYKDMDHL
jgi:hypothetical protein